MMRSPAAPRQAEACPPEAWVSPRGWDSSGGSISSQDRSPNHGGSAFRLTSAQASACGRDAT